jgi:hypothetical protein
MNGKPTIDFEFPAKGELALLAEEVLNDFDETSGLVVRPRPPREGEIAFHFDPTPLVIAVITMILKEIARYLKGRISEKRAKSEPTPIVIDEAELKEIRRLVLGFGQKIGDKELLTPEVSAKLADSIERLVLRKPETLLRYQPHMNPKGLGENSHFG